MKHPSTLARVVWSAIAGSGVLAGCATTIAKPVGNGGSCIPVMCPVGTLDVGGGPRAARLDGDELTLLVEQQSMYSQPTKVQLGTLGGGYTQVSGFGDVQGQIAASASVSDGFIVVMAPDISEIYDENHHAYDHDPVRMEVSRVVGVHVQWTQPLITSSDSRSPEDGLVLATTVDELALVYPVDEGDFDMAFIVERRSIETGELIERVRYPNATTYASLDLAYTQKGLVFVWSPSSHLSGSRMFMAVVGERAKPLPCSGNNGEVALLSNAAIAVERPSLALGRLRMNGRTIARFAGPMVFANRLAVIESDAGIAVTFFGSEYAKKNRTGFQMLIGDSGVGLRLSSEPDRWYPHGPPTTLRLDRARLLYVDAQDPPELSILGCAGSSAVDGLACETPEQLRL
jgi:hypothetical protein